MEETKKYEPSNPNLYKIAPGEIKKKRQKRRDKMTKDINDRLQLLVQKTGAMQFPSINPAILEKKTIIKVLTDAGLTTEDGFEDIYHREIDKAVQALEGKVEEIKAEVIEQKSKAAGKATGIHLPPGFRGKKTGIVRA